jgi:hypothetical protein
MQVGEKLNTWKIGQTERVLFYIFLFEKSSKKEKKKE